MGAAQWTYNQCVTWLLKESFRPLRCDEEHHVWPDKIRLRKYFCNNSNFGEKPKKHETVDWTCQIDLGAEQHLLDGYDGTAPHLLAWVLNTPNHVWQLAIREFAAAYSANMKKAGIAKHSQAKKKVKDGQRHQTQMKWQRAKFFRIKYRKKKVPQQMVSIPQNGWMCGRRSKYYDLFGLDENSRMPNMRAAAKLPAMMEHAFKVMRTQTN